MENIAVFCGSSNGAKKIYNTQATLLGETLANKNIGLVYGGAKIGLMGAVANGALSKNGQVTGVIPTFLQEKEVAHEGLSKLILVEDMHQRKTKMSALCDGIITLPGGFGTMEELFEMLTWSALDLHKKPIGLLNTDGFYDSFINFIDFMAEQNFLKPENKSKLLISNSIDELLTKMEEFSNKTL